jgi:glycogen synthase
MRILFLTNYYPPFEVGGYEQLCRDVAQRFAQRGHVIDVLTSNYGTKGAVADDAGIHRVLKLQRDPRSALHPALQFAFTRRRVEAHDIRCLRSAAAQCRPEVIFIWNLQGLPRSLSLEAEHTLGAATVYWLAGYSPSEPDEYELYWSDAARGTVLRCLKAPLGRWARRVLAAEGKPVRPYMRNVAVVSEFMQQKGMADGTLPDHAQVIYNGVEIERFYRPVPETSDGTLRLLQAGRVTQDKGVHLAVEALGKLARQKSGVDIRLFIAGTGPSAYRDQLEVLARQCGIQREVEFLGWQSRETMPELMKRCDVLLLPTVHPEPFARVVLEAMAAGLVVVAALTGGTGELVEPEVTGLTFSPPDSDDLARQVARLATDPTLRYRLASNGQAVVRERFSLDHMVDQLEALMVRASRPSTAKPEDTPGVHVNQRGNAQ